MLPNLQMCSKGGISNYYSHTWKYLRAVECALLPVQFTNEWSGHSWISLCTYDEIFGQAHISYIYPETLGFWKRQTSWKPSSARASPLPLVWKTRNIFRNVMIKHISDFHKRWGNGGLFDWFAADYLMYSGHPGMLWFFLLSLLVEI